MTIESINAVTVGTHDMAASCEFYKALGFVMGYGGPGTTFTNYRLGSQHFNVILEDDEMQWAWWGRVIFHVDDVDAVHRLALAAGYRPSTEPRDAEWGERYFHISDPDGHELSFARRLPLQ